MVCKLMRSCFQSDSNKEVSKMIQIPLQYPAAITGSIMFIVTGMLFGWPAPSLPQLLQPNSKIQITTSDGAWLAVMPGIGAIIACLIAAKIVDMIGRKVCLLFTSPLYFASWLLIAFATNKHSLHTARILSGLADGFAFTVFPMYLGEIADSKVRGLLCSSMPITMGLGYLLISVIGSTYNIQDTALFSSVLPIIHFVLFVFMPESPYYLIMKNQPKEASKSLIKLRGHQNVNEEMNRLSSSVKEDEDNKGNIWDLFTVESNRKAVYIIAIMRGLQQLSGLLVITFYITIIFDESKASLSPAVGTNIFFGIQVICCVVSSFLVDKVGRKPLLVISTIVACLALGAQGGYLYVKENNIFDLSELSNFTWIPVVSLLTYNVFFSIGMGNIPSLLLGELFPTSVKAFALCLADIYVGIVIVIVTKFFQIMTDTTGMFVPFFVFAAFNIVTLIYVVLCLPETKGRTLEEIQSYLKMSN